MEKEQTVILAQLGAKPNYSQYLKLCEESGVPMMGIDSFLSVTGQSTGLGDTIAKITAATGLDKLSEIYIKITGKDCGCKSRQEALNKLFPYSVKETE